MASEKLIIEKNKPLVVHRMTVPPDWIDFNGHMNVAYYVLGFDYAADAMFDFFDFGDDYRDRHQMSTFAVEAHIVYVGFERAGIYRSDNAGEDWRPLPAGLNPEASVSHIVFDSANSQIVYIADRLSGVYRSDNGGTIWSPMNDGLRVRAVNALALSANGGHLYAATEGEGVFRLDLTGRSPASSSQGGL